MSSDDGPSIGELSRQVTEAMLRLTSITQKLESQVITKEYFDLYREGVNHQLEGLQNRDESIENTRVANVEYVALEKRVTAIEGNTTWFMRTILGVIITAILVALFAYFGLR